MGLWEEQQGFLTASSKVSSLVLRPERNFSRESWPEQLLFHNIPCGPEEAVDEMQEGSRLWVWQPSQKHSFHFLMHEWCSADLCWTNGWMNE